MNDPVRPQSITTDHDTDHTGLYAPGPADDLAAGTTLLGRYRIEAELGRGGMGQVYLARDETLHRKVAVKRVRPSDPAVRERTIGDRRLRDGFIQEARIGANLTHPAIATVFDFGFHEDEPFIVFEYVDGETLADALRRRGRFPLDEARLILASLAQGLQHAHSRQVVHRDLKPANIRCTAQGNWKVLDLGLARAFREGGGWGFAGTPQYASPEQAAGLPCDGRTDQYALALIAFEMLSGRRPFTASGMVEVLRQHQEEPPPSLRELQPDVPPSVAAAIARALSKDPAERFPDCEAFAAALGCQFLSASPDRYEIRHMTTVKKMAGLWRNDWLSAPVGDAGAHLFLAGGALWVSCRGEVRNWPLAEVGFASEGEKDERERSRWLRLTLSGKQQAFFFQTREKCQEWRRLLREEVDWAAAETSDERAAPLPLIEPVVFLDRVPPIRHQVLGEVDCTANNRSRAEAGLRVRALLMGGDAVVVPKEERLAGMEGTQWCHSGTVIRAADAAGRVELLVRWLGSRCRRVADQLLIWLGVAFAYRLLSLALFAAFPVLLQTSGLRDHPGLAGVGVAVALYAWPVAVALWLRTTRAPQLLLPAAASFLVLAVMPHVVSLFTVLAALDSGMAYQMMLVTVIDPVQIALIVAGLYFVFHVRKVFRDPAAIALSMREPAGGSRPLTWWVAWTVTAVVAVAMLGVAVVGGVAMGMGMSPGLGQPGPVGPTLDPKVVAASTRLQAAAARFRSDPTSMEREMRELLAVYDSFGPQHPAGEVIRVDRATCLLNIGMVAVSTGRPRDGEGSFQRALEAYRTVKAQGALDAIVQRNTLLACQQLGFLLMNRGQPAEGAAVCREGLAAYRALAAPDDSARLWCTHCYQNLGACLIDLEQADEAAAAFRDALKMADRLGPTAQRSPELRFARASCRVGLGVALTKRDAAKAAESLRRAIAELRELENLIPGNPQPAQRRAVAERILATLPR